MPRCPKGTRKNKKTGECEPYEKKKKEKEHRIEEGKQEKQEKEKEDSKSKLNSEYKMRETEDIGTKKYKLDELHHHNEGAENMDWDLDDQTNVPLTEEMKEFNRQQVKKLDRF